MAWHWIKYIFVVHVQNHLEFVDDQKLLWIINFLFLKIIFFIYNDNYKCIKTHYGDQKMLSQILFFESMWLSTSDKLALKKGF